MTVQKNAICIECGEEAKYYSTYDNECVLFSSAPCHDKYNEKAEKKNFILVKLDVEEDIDAKSTDHDNEDVENMSEIFQVCHRGDGNHEKLRTLLENGEDVNQKNKKGQTLLTYSIAKGDLKILDVLLGAGADVNESDGNGQTPLMVAAGIGAEKKVAFLLRHEVEVTSQDSEGKTALHKTETNKDTQCAKILLENNRSIVNIKDKFDQTAVHVVAGEGNDNVLAIFLEYEPNITDLDNLGRTPLNCSVLQKAEKCVELLLNYKDGNQDGFQVIDVADRFGFAPIHYAIQANNINIVQMLVEKGSDINKKDNRGQTALLSAVSLGHTDICKELLDKCEDKNAVDSKGYSALHHAAMKGQIEICELLIQNGADVNLQDKKQQTCIFGTVLNNEEATVKMLIKKGAKCNGSVRDEQGRTPLHHAAEKGNINMLKMLLEDAGLTVDGSTPETHTLNLQDNNKSSVLYIAAFHEYKECCQILIDKGVFIDEASRGSLIAMGVIEEERVEEKEVEPEEMSPRERYAAEPAPMPEEEKVEDLPIEPVTDHQEVANNSRHISEEKQKRKKRRELRARRVKPFPGNENSPYLMSMLSEDVLHKKNRYLGMKPAYLSRSLNNLSISSRSSSSSNISSHGRRYSYSNDNS